MKKQPNIIFFFSDQQRHDTLGTYNEALKKFNISPNLDTLAENGVKFNLAFTPQPVCGPARACLQTGKYPTQIGCFTNGRQLKPNEPTVAKMFNAAGYDTAYFGKWHLAANGRPAEGEEKTSFIQKGVPEELRGGYQYWRASDVLEHTSHGYDGWIFDNDLNRLDFKGYRADCITDYALEYIENRNADKPFYMFISQIEPHHQNDRNTYEGPVGSVEKFKGYPVPPDLADTKGDWRENYENYLGCCNSLDYNVGRIVDLLKNKGVYEDTIIIYTTDHSCHFRTRNGEYKRSCHDNSIHIPLIISGGKFTGGHEINNLVSLIDLPPTILECAGIDIPADFMGRSLLKLAGGDIPDSEWGDDVFTQISEAVIGRSLRTKKWKYFVAAKGNPGSDAGSDIYYEKLMYDLESDPCEKNNLAEDPSLAGVRGEMRQRLIKHMASIGEPPVTILPAAEWTDT